MGQWVMKKVNESRMEAAEATARAREQDLRNPVKIRAAWRPGELDEYRESVSKYEKEIKSLYAQRTTKFLQDLKALIGECYEPDEGEAKPSDEAVQAVAMSITKDTVGCLLQKAIINKEQIWSSMIANSVGDELAELSARQSPKIPISGDAYKALGQEIEKRKANPDIIISEIQKDIEMIDRYITMIEEFEKHGSARILLGIFNPDVLKIDTFPAESYPIWNKARAIDAVLRLEDERYITTPGAVGRFKEAFDSDETAKHLASMFQDIEWSNDSKTLRMEKAILTALKDTAILPLLLKHMIPNINADFKKALLDAIHKANDLYIQKEFVAINLAGAAVTQAQHKMLNSGL